MLIAVGKKITDTNANINTYKQHTETRKPKTDVYLRGQSQNKGQKFARKF